MQVLKQWIKKSLEDRLAEEAIRILSSSKEEVESMVASNAFILTEIEEKAKVKGREEGIKEGIREVAQNLLDILDDRTISEKTGLTIEEVRSLRAAKKS